GSRPTTDSHVVTGNHESTGLRPRRRRVIGEDKTDGGGVPVGVTPPGRFLPAGRYGGHRGQLDEGCFILNRHPLAIGRHLLCAEHLSMGTAIRLRQRLQKSRVIHRLTFAYFFQIIVQSITRSSQLENSSPKPNTITIAPKYYPRLIMSLKCRIVPVTPFEQNCS